MRSRHLRKIPWIALLALPFIIELSAPARADTGMVRAYITKGGLIVGVGGGRGVLTFRHRHYPLTISGVSFGATIGASTTDLRGHAFNLQTANDIEGNYSAVGAGGAVAAGAGGVRLQNAKGVILELAGAKVGLEFSAGISGINVKLTSHQRLAAER
jgi:hypothetical protein